MGILEVHVCYRVHGKYYGFDKNRRHRNQIWIIFFLMNRGKFNLNGDNLLQANANKYGIYLYVQD